MEPLTLKRNKTKRTKRTSATRRMKSRVLGRSSVGRTRYRCNLTSRTTGLDEFLGVLRVDGTTGMGIGMGRWHLTCGTYRPVSEDDGDGWDTESHWFVLVVDGRLNFSHPCLQVF